MNKICKHRKSSQSMCLSDQGFQHSTEVNINQYIKWDNGISPNVKLWLAPSYLSFISFYFLTPRLEIPNPVLISPNALTWHKNKWLGQCLGPNQRGPELALFLPPPLQTSFSFLVQKHVTRLMTTDRLTYLGILDNLLQAHEGLGLTVTEFLGCSYTTNLGSTFTFREGKSMIFLSAKLDK